MERNIVLDVSWQRRVVSFLLSFPYNIIRLFYKRKFSIQARKILVIQWDYLGDIIVSIPALRALRNIYPLAEIYLLTSPENKSYIDGFPFVNKILYIKNPLHIGRRRFALKDFFTCISKLRKEKIKTLCDMILEEIKGELKDRMKDRKIVKL